MWCTTSKADILCFQETHLCTLLEFAFELHAQGYDFYYSHSTLASVGVCTVICQQLGVTVTRAAEIPGCLLALDLESDGQIICIINIYAPNLPLDRTDFFNQLENLVMVDTMLLGDFNSITQMCDQASRKLDHTSALLDRILHKHKLFEPQGSHIHTFTYHHPAVSACKSRLDRIYINYPIPRIRGYAHHVKFSGHYLVGLFTLKNPNMGPKPWCFPDDLHNDSNFVLQVGLILDNFDVKRPTSRECIKSKIQMLAQKRVAFWKKQLQLKMKSLKKTLRKINLCIF